MSVKYRYVPVFISFWWSLRLAPKWWVRGRQHASTCDRSCGWQTNNPSSRRPKWGAGASGCGCLRSSDLLMHRSRTGNTRMSPFPGQPGLCRSNCRTSPPSLWRPGWWCHRAQCSNLVRSPSRGHRWSGPRHYGGWKWHTYQHLIGPALTLSCGIPIIPFSHRTLSPASIASRSPLDFRSLKNWQAVMRFPLAG